MKAHVLSAGTIWEGNFLEAPLEPGYTLAILDGAYGLQKAAWDRVSLDNLPDWYAPHLARVSSLLAASASLYVWNTAPGLKRLDPVIRGLGWVWRADITWDKCASVAMVNVAVQWADVTEVCGYYTRGDVGVRKVDPLSNVWRLATSEYADEKARGEPVSSGCASFSALHPCQKPLLFAERMIRASTRPGERVLIPFGGTNREAVVMEWMARSTPDEARRYDACELNQDPGRDYIGAALAQIRGEDPRAKAAGQVPMFGGAA